MSIHKPIELTPSYKTVRKFPLYRHLVKYSTAQNIDLEKSCFVFILLCGFCVFFVADVWVTCL